MRGKITLKELKAPILKSEKKITKLCQFLMNTRINRLNNIINLFFTSIAVKCPCTGKIANGIHRGSRTLGGTTTITCNAGFKASGTATLNCVNGKWDSPVPQCIGELTWAGFH